MCTLHKRLSGELWVAQGSMLEKIVASFAAVVATTMALGCTGAPSTGGASAADGAAPPVGAVGETGKVALRLSLGGETEIDSVKYVLQNGSAVVQQGTLLTNNSAAINFELGQIPSGPGYSITLSASSPDGGVSCLGSSGTFTVQPRATIPEQVQLICTSGAIDSGMVVAKGLESFCGTWQSVSTIGPGVDAGATNGSEVRANGVTPIVITATANGADTAALKYNWSVLASMGGGVSLGAQTGNGTTTGSVTLTCNPSITGGGATIQLVVTDSEDGGAVTCPSSLSTTTVDVTCDCIFDCPAGSALCPGNGSSCGPCGCGVCANLQADNNNCGACNNACPAGTVCVNAACVCPAGRVFCNGQCVDEATDPNNCGACGVVCAGANPVCNGGSCFRGTPCLSADFQCACNEFIAVSEVGNTPNAPCNASEVSAFKVDANTATEGSCLDCLLNAGQCLDNPALGTSGLDCDDPFTGAGAGETTAECTAVLECDTGVTPAAIPPPVSATASSPLVGYCGTSAFGPCESGSLLPNGPCMAEIVAGFPPSFGPAQIGANIAIPQYASGRAGKIVACAINNCAQCLTGSAN
jgi:hypothetical protein